MWFYLRNLSKISPSLLSPWSKLLSSQDWCTSLLTSWFHQNRLGFCSKTFNFPNLSGLTPPKIHISVHKYLVHIGKLKELRGASYDYSGIQVHWGCANYYVTNWSSRGRERLENYKPQHRSDIPHYCWQGDVQT